MATSECVLHQRPRPGSRPVSQPGCSTSDRVECLIELTRENERVALAEVRLTWVQLDPDTLHAMDES